ncbi:MAG: hypothetical protein LBI19_03310 [Oscillospiraceae bacterium]|jgi:hypothetical protein|nr:hypothetical protein [Oscillospiraceae bacterium]
MKPDQKLRRPRLIIGSILSVVFFFLAGMLLHSVIWGALAPGPDAAASQRNLTVLEEAYYVAEAISEGDYLRLGGYISDKGLLLVPFSTVDDGSLTFSAGEVRSFAATGEQYLFGIDPATSQPIKLTPADYMTAYLRDVNYAEAPMLGVNNIVRRGNAVENVTEAFPDGVFVDFFFPSSQPGGFDWKSLKVVFEEEGGRFRLVALIRGVYTDQ